MIFERLQKEFEAARASQTQGIFVVIIFFQLGTLLIVQVKY